MKKTDNFPKSSLFNKLLLVVVLLVVGIIVVFLLNYKGAIPFKKQVPENKYMAFIDEVYDTIKENYWEKISDEQLGEVYVLAAEKITEQTLNLESKDRDSVRKMLEKIISEKESADQKKEFVVLISDIVLVNLKPFSRSRLYTQKMEENLQNNVNNINPDINHYENLGLKKEASTSGIKKAFVEKSAFWNPDTNKTPEAKEKYEEVQQAYKVLGDQESRKTYDISGVEPTMDYKLVRPNIFYIHINKFSPTTVEELDRVAKKTDSKPEVDTLILDLRDNVGGAIDGLVYFLGPFLGIDQYAYQFFHQDEKQDFKTKAGWLPSLIRFKKVVVLINGGAQSSAEVMAASLKKYNVGILIGEKTKGWGTVERVFPLENQIDENEKHSMFLVHSLTLREDGQPIEGNGVEPTIDINSADWKEQLFSYFHYDELGDAVEEVWRE